MREIYNAEDRIHAEKAIEAFKKTYGAKFHKAVAKARWRAITGAHLVPLVRAAPASRTASWSSVRRPPPPDHRPNTSVASGRSCPSLAE